jgi:hypothetical protein
MTTANRHVGALRPERHVPKLAALTLTCHSGARAQHANPESRCYRAKAWIPGSRLAARPGMTVTTSAAWY